MDFVVLHQCQFHSAAVHYLSKRILGARDDRLLVYDDRDDVVCVDRNSRVELN